MVDEDHLVRVLPDGEPAPRHVDGRVQRLRQRATRRRTSARCSTWRRDLFPAGGDYSNPEYWAGLRPMTPTTVPIFGFALYRNLMLNVGHGHIGWTMSCGFGEGRRGT